MNQKLIPILQELSWAKGIEALLGVVATGAALTKGKGQKAFLTDMTLKHSDI